MTVPILPTHGTAAEPSHPRRAWTTPKVRRLPTSKAESGGTNGADGIEILS
jgi:hypothetical protein